MRQSLFSVLLFLLFTFARAASSTGNRLLVVLEELGDKERYSKFWGDLEGRGFKLSFESPKSEPKLFELGERAYDHVVLLPPKSKGLGPSLTPQILLDFVNKDGNILLALSANAPTPMGLVSLLLELDINLPPDRNDRVVDHFNYDTLSAGEDHDVLLVSQHRSLRQDVKNFFHVDGILALPRAVPQVLGNASPLLAPIVSAPSTAYTYSSKEDSESAEDLFGVGKQLALVSAMQARNSARVTVLGSSEMLQNTWFDASVQIEGQKKTKTANQEFVKALSAWTFKELGVLKVGKLHHYLSKGTGSDSIKESSISRADLDPKIYRIKNDVTYTIEVSEYIYDRLAPFNFPANDALQLEFTMLSPFHRINLTPSSSSANSTTYSTSFRLPDQHGIFNFRVNYKRPFLSNVDEKRQVTVRHFAHDEWPRSYVISGAWVWIAGIWVTVAGWLAFLVVWLYSAPVDQARMGKKTQ